MANSDFDKLLAEAAEKIRQDAFVAGWQAAVATIRKAIDAEAPQYATASHVLDVNPETPSKNSQLPGPMPGTIPFFVLQAVRKQPGMNGAQIVAAVLETGIKTTTEAAIRTAIGRLAKRKLIVSRHKKWYPA